MRRVLEERPRYALACALAAAALLAVAVLIATSAGGEASRPAAGPASASSPSGKTEGVPGTTKPYVAPQLPEGQVNITGPDSLLMKTFGRLALQG